MLSMFYDEECVIPMIKKTTIGLTAAARSHGKNRVTLQKPGYTGQIMHQMWPPGTARLSGLRRDGLFVHIWNISAVTDMILVQLK